MAAVSATAIRARNGEARAKKDALKEAARATAGEKKAKEEAERANNLVYAADMNLAQQAYEAGDVVRVEQLLKETESGADRGWEWNYLNRAVHTERLAIKAGDDYVEAKFTGDGKRIVTVEQTYEDVRCSW